MQVIDSQVIENVIENAVRHNQPGGSIELTLAPVHGELAQVIIDSSGPVLDQETGRLISSHVMNQDFVAWVGQGTIPDRTNEHLGRSDEGIIMMRQRFLKDIDAIARGEDPKATVRDPASNRCIALPIADRKNLTEGQTLEEIARHPLGGGQLSDYVFQAGQPREVRKAYAKAMGISE